MKLPRGLRAGLFDLDGVLTDTARVHRAAWGATFEAAGYGPFTDEDYLDHVDGRPREDGIRAFLAARGVEHPDEALVEQLADRKTEAFLAEVAAHGVRALPGAADLLREMRTTGVRTVVVTSSSNRDVVVRAAGLDGLFDAAIDGQVRRARGLAGKPAPDTFLAGAQAVGVGADQAAVFEDAIAGVEAGRAGGFAVVVGVNSVRRPEHAEALRAHGATLVVEDLGELL